MRAMSSIDINLPPRAGAVPARVHRLLARGFQRQRMLKVAMPMPYIHIPLGCSPQPHLSAESILLRFG